MADDGQGVDMLMTVNEVGKDPCGKLECSDLSAAVPADLGLIEASTEGTQDELGEWQKRAGCVEMGGIFRRHARTA